MPFALSSHRRTGSISSTAAFASPDPHAAGTLSQPSTPCAPFFFTSAFGSPPASRYAFSFTAPAHHPRDRQSLHPHPHTAPAFYTMDADPWADAPASPASRTQSPAKSPIAEPASSVPTSPASSPQAKRASIGFPSSPTKAGAGSPLAGAEADEEDEDDGDIGLAASPKRSASPLRPASPSKSATASPAVSASASPLAASPVRSVRSVTDEPESPVAETDPYAAPATPAPRDDVFGDAFDDGDQDADDFGLQVDKAALGVGSVALGNTQSDEENDDGEAIRTPEPEAAPLPSEPAHLSLSPPPATTTIGDEFGPDNDDDGFGDADFDDAPVQAAFDGGDEGFGDFDDFDAPATSFGDDEGFGDFGDFDEGAPATAVAGKEAPPVPAPAPVVDWHALSLRPVPPHGELLLRIATILEPLSVADSTSNFTDESPRAVGGLAQVLATESTRDTFAQLTTAPMLKPLDWTRSRVRRDHLISMGVPVNLDEVDSHRLSTLPPLQITTAFPHSPSAGPERVRRSGSAGPPRSAPGSGPASAAPTLGGAETERKYGLGPRPPLALARAEELCGLEEEQLALMPLAKLEALHADLAAHTADASALLAWFLQLKDAQQHDSATYNGMISELIANAAKVKGGSTGGGLFRRNSGRPSSLSATPRRSGSPGVF